MIYGCARVSTDGRSVDAQVRQFRAARAGQAFRKTASRAKTERAQLRRVLGQFAAGDVLLMTRLDRLARSIPRPPQRSRRDRRPQGRLPLPWRRLGDTTPPTAA